MDNQQAEGQLFICRIESVNSQEPCKYLEQERIITIMYKSREESERKVIIRLPRIWEAGSENLQGHLSNLEGQMDTPIGVAELKLNYYESKFWWILGTIKNEGQIFYGNEKGGGSAVINVENYEQDEFYFGISTNANVNGISTNANVNEIQQFAYKIELQCLTEQVCTLKNLKRVAPSPNEVQLIWHSKIQLHYKIKKCIHKVINSRQISSFHCQLLINKQLIIFAYNRERTVLNAIEYYGEKQRGKEKKIEENQSLFSIQLMKIGEISRLRYPYAYYEKLYELYHRLKGEIKAEYSFDEIVKILRYSMIEGVELKAIFQQSEEQESRINKILQINEQLLTADPLDSTVIIYWILGMPGCGKTQIYSNLEEQILIFNARVLRITQQHISVFKQILTAYLTRLDLFQHERFAFIFVEINFTIQKLEDTLSLIELYLPKQIFYQLYLITPLIDNQHHFKQEHYSSNRTISYTFPIDFIICSLLNSMQKSRGESIFNLTTMLHYISSVYGNLNLRKFVREECVCMGNVEIIEYESGALIDWSSLEKSQREEIEDGLRVLLELSFKGPTEQDSFLWYFLENIQSLDCTFTVNGIAQFIIAETFKNLPFIDFYN